MSQWEKDDSINVFGQPLELCGADPKTGFFRDGCCNTSTQDRGSLAICVKLTEDFLTFSKARGNDLSTPRPEYDFPGLIPGDRWCLCASRWLEAYNHDAAPKIYLARTHQKALEIVPLELMQSFALDLQ